MKISVYITSYNQADFLSQSVESVLNQTFKPFEIIIIDDCSTDHSQDVIRKYEKEYPNLIKSHFNETNIGITKSRNKAISLVTGDYLTWLDGDDIYKPKKLEIESKVLQESSADLVYSNFYYSNDKIEDIFQIWCSHINQLPKNNNIFYEVISRKFPKGSLYRYELVNMQLVNRTGFYDENLKIYEDFDFRIRLCEHAKTAFNLEPLSVYRMHENGLSRAANKLHLESLSYIFSKYEKQILKLDNKTRETTQSSINKILDQFSNNSLEGANSVSFKTKLKSKLTKIINKI